MMARKQTNKHCAFPACVSCMIAAQHEMINDLRKGEAETKGRTIFVAEPQQINQYTRSPRPCVQPQLSPAIERPTIIFSSVSRNLFLVR